MWSKAALITLVSTALIGAASPAKPYFPRQQTYMVQLTGEAQWRSAPTSDGAGDMDGSGLVKLTVDPAGKKICYDFTLVELATPLMAHIHKGPARSNGPTVVTLFTGPGGELADCVTWTQKRLAEIVSNPSNFYVNFYTTEFPDGALRGQLVS